MSDDHKTKLAVIERSDVQAMSPVVAAILDKGAGLDPDALQKMLDVQKAWEANEARKAYARALVDLKRDLPAVIAKDKEVRFKATHYTHASLAGVLNQIEGALTQHGFTLTWETTNNGDKREVSVHCRLLHCAGHSESTTLTAPADTSGSKNPIQSIGSTVTYLQRYTALALLGITTADMPDADQRKDNPDAVSLSRNMDVAAKLGGMGKAVPEAEQHIGRPMAEWTSADIDRLRAWAKQ